MSSKKEPVNVLNIDSNVDDRKSKCSTKYSDILENLLRIEKSQNNFEVMREKLNKCIDQIENIDKVNEDRIFYEMALNNEKISIPIVKELINMDRIMRARLPIADNFSSFISTHRQGGEQFINDAALPLGENIEFPNFKTMPKTDLQQQNLTYCFKKQHNLAFAAPRHINLAFLAGGGNHILMPTKNEIRRGKRKYYQLQEINEPLMQIHMNDDVPYFLQPEFPKRKNCEFGQIVIIGPNGTQIPAHKFDEITWNSAPAATRALLGNVFDVETLANHTLTGKPSPAFYGRERPPKMQLDPLKTADVIHCVLIKCGCTEREVRAAITTKCADTSKKLRRISIKDMK